MWHMWANSARATIMQMIEWGTDDVEELEKYYIDIFNVTDRQISVGTIRDKKSCVSTTPTGH